MLASDKKYKQTNTQQQQQQKLIDWVIKGGKWTEYLSEKETPFIILILDS